MPFVLTVAINSLYSNIEQPMTTTHAPLPQRRRWNLNKSREAGDTSKEKRSLANRNVNFVASRELIYICCMSVGGGSSFGLDWIGLAWLGLDWIGVLHSTLLFIGNTSRTDADEPNGVKIKQKLCPDNSDKKKRWQNQIHSQAA